MNASHLPAVAVFRCGKVNEEGIAVALIVDVKAYSTDPSKKSPAGFKMPLGLGQGLGQEVVTFSNGVTIVPLVRSISPETRNPTDPHADNTPRYPTSQEIKITRQDSDLHRGFKLSRPSPILGALHEQVTNSGLTMRNFLAMDNFFRGNGCQERISGGRDLDAAILTRENTWIMSWDDFLTTPWESYRSGSPAGATKVEWQFLRTGSSTVVGPFQWNNDGTPCKLFATDLAAEAAQRRVSRGDEAFTTFQLACLHVVACVMAELAAQPRGTDTFWIQPCWLKVVRPYVAELKGLLDQHGESVAFVQALRSMQMRAPCNFPNASGMHAPFAHLLDGTPAFVRPRVELLIAAASMDKVAMRAVPEAVREPILQSVPLYMKKGRDPVHVPYSLAQPDEPLGSWMLRKNDTRGKKRVTEEMEQPSEAHSGDI